MKCTKNQTAKKKHENIRYNNKQLLITYSNGINVTLQLMASPEQNEKKIKAGYLTRT